MDTDGIFQVLKSTILEIVPELKSRNIAMSDSLKDLGVNSIDRAEVLIQTMSDLQINVSLPEFGGAKNIEDIVSVFVKHSGKSS